MDRSTDRTAIVVAGQRRTFMVRSPATAPAPSSNRPLVIMLHGGGGNAANAKQMSGLTALVEREGIFVAYPERTFRARANGCDATPAVETRGTVVHTRFRCPAGRDVELYALTDGGHA